MFSSVAPIRSPLQGTKDIGAGNETDRIFRLGLTETSNFRFSIVDVRYAHVVV